MIRRVIVTFLSAFVCISIAANIERSDSLFGTEANILDVRLALDEEPSDSPTWNILRKPMKNFEVGEAGYDILWDFSGMVEMDKENIAMISIDSLDNISLIAINQIHHYSIDSTSVRYLGTENTRQRLYYDVPIEIYRYPLSYGDSLSSSFCGHGTYCSNHPLTERGFYSMKVDGYGDIVFDANETIHNALRIHSVRTYSIAMEEAPSYNDTIGQKLIIEDIYQWFVPNIKYPIIDSCVRTCYCKSQMVNSSSEAYCNIVPSLLKNNEAINMLSNKTNEEEQLENENKQDNVAGITIHVENRKIIVTMSLRKDVKVRAIVADVTGCSYLYDEHILSKGECQSFGINTDALRNGKYILHLNIDGKIYSYKINL